jgi:hypothetical protein
LVVYLQAVRPERARQAIEQALLLVPDAVEALLHSALCLARLGEVEAARDTNYQLRASDQELNAKAAEKFVRYLFNGSDTSEAHAADVRAMWHEIESAA